MKNKIPFEYKISLSYVLIGALWILFSDKLVVHITTDYRQIQLLSTYKGWFYVLVTGILLFILIKREIKRRNEMAAQLLKAKKKAEESDQLKTAFLANLSHYVRTPMNSILGFMSLLEEKDTNQERQRTYRKYIQEQSELFLSTLHTIIEISKIQEGLVDINKEDFSINNLLREMKESLSLEISQKNAPINLQLILGYKEEKDRVKGDRPKIHQILMQLLSNAIHFTEAGSIVIGYKEEKNNLVFWVEDSGKGIQEDKRAYILSGFMQQQAYTRALSEGVGLGLYLSAGLAKLIGGKLWLEKTGDRGSTFCFSIPIQEIQ